MIAKELWPILFQELKTKEKEVKAIAEEIKRQDVQKQEEIERLQTIKPPIAIWHRMGRPPGSKSKTTVERVKKKQKERKPKQSSKKLKTKMHDHGTKNNKKTS